MTLLFLDGSHTLEQIKEHKLPTIFLPAGKVDLSHAFEGYVTLNFRRKPFIISAGDRYLLFAQLTPTLYTKVYMAVLQHLIAEDATKDDDAMFTQIVKLNKPYSASLRNKHPKLSQL